MGWWSDARDKTRTFVEQAVDWSGSRLGDATGVTRIGRDFGQNLGQHMNLTIDGGHKIDVDIQFKDLVTAAQLIKDGLSSFDLFGGLLRQFRSDVERLDEAKRFLRDLALILRQGHCDQAQDFFFFEVSLANATAHQPESPTGSPAPIQVDKACACAITLQLNATLIAKDLVLTLPASAKGQPAATRIQQEIMTQGVAFGAENTLILSVDSTVGDVGGELLANSKIRVRFVRQTRYWRHTLLEWVCDGHSGGSRCSASVFLGDPTWTSCPQPSDRANALAAKLESLAATYNVPNLPSHLPDPGAVTSIAALMSATFFSAFRERMALLEEVDHALMDIDAETNAQGILDVRTPVVATISCLAGKVQATVTSASAAEPSPRVAIGRVDLGAGDMVAIRLPLRAGRGIDRAHIGKHAVRFSAKDISGGACTARVFSGFDWRSRVLGGLTMVAPMSLPGDYELPITIGDVLA